MKTRTTHRYGKWKHFCLSVTLSLFAIISFAHAFGVGESFVQDQLFAICERSEQHPVLGIKCYSNNKTGRQQLFCGCPKNEMIEYFILGTKTNSQPTKNGVQIVCA
jgi:hypothetical protein